MSDSTHLTWQNFESYFLGGPPREVVMPGAAKLTLFVSPEDQTFGMRLPATTQDTLPRSTVDSIRIRSIRVKGQSLIEICCIPQARTKEFFYFLLAISDSVQLRRLRFAEAYDTALIAWKGLLKTSQRMSEEDEIGLYGELLTLQLLIKVLGTAALGHWVGSLGDRHDFRIGSHELEVKTTSGSRRTHIINGLDQLHPSRNCSLSIVSWQLERSGGALGRTLPQLIRHIKEHLTESPGTTNDFASHLARRTVGQDLESGHFPVQWRPRDLPRLIIVDSD